MHPRCWLIAEVRPNQTGSIIVKGGVGVAKVTKGGLGLEIGTWAVNPVPQKNIKEMVAEELMGAPSFFWGQEVIISVPRGEGDGERNSQCSARVNWGD